MATVVVQSSTQITDALGVTTTSDLFLQMADTVTLAGLNTWAADYLPLLDAITDGQISGQVFHVHGTLPAGIKVSPASTAEVERTGLFNFSQSSSRYKFGIDVPAIADSKITGGKINLSDSDISAWKTFIGAVTAGVTVVSKFALALGALLDALISFRKHRKAESRRSFEVT